MAVLIKDEEADRLIRELAQRTRETITDAVKTAVAERLQRVPLNEGEIAARKLKPAEHLTCFDSLPKMNERLTNDEIIGYDENGLPT